MEVVMQWLDELDDLAAMVAAKLEGLWRWLQLVAATLVLTLGALALLLQPPYVPALLCLSGVALLYRFQLGRQRDRVLAKP